MRHPAVLTTVFLVLVTVILMMLALFTKVAPASSLASTGVNFGTVIRHATQPLFFVSPPAQLTASALALTHLPTSRFTAMPTYTPSATLTPSVTPTLSNVTLLVTNLEDKGAGSLRDIIDHAPRGATINFAPTLHGTIVFDGTIYITKDLTINGISPNPSTITLSGNDSYGILSIDPSVNVSLSYMTFAHGKAADGGGIANKGTLNISNLIFSNNKATFGGAIANAGTVHVRNSTFQDNNKGNEAIGNNYGSVTIINSTFYNNSGAIENILGTILSVNNSFKNNGTGGWWTIYNDPPSSNNTATPSTGTPPPPNGLGKVSSVILINTIIDGSSSSVTCNGGITDGGNNLQFPRQDCGSTIPIADPKLGLPQDNGGATLTLALLAGSPAIDAGSNSACHDFGLESDQRHLPRIVDGHSGRGKVCDIGAFEYSGN